jgi:hypothetical protein
MNTIIDNAAEFFGVGMNQGVDNGTARSDRGEAAIPKMGTLSREIPYRDLTPKMQQFVRRKWAQEHPDEPFEPDNVAVQVGVPEGVDLDDLMGGIPEELRDALKQAMEEQDADVDTYFTQSLTHLTSLADEYRAVCDALAAMRKDLLELERQIEHRERVVLGELDDDEGLGSNDTQREVRIGAAIESDRGLAQMLDERAELRGKIAEGESYEQGRRRTLHVAEKLVGATLQFHSNTAMEAELDVRKSELVRDLLAAVKGQSTEEIVESMKTLKEVSEALE